jgi:hypothetical protein
MNLLSCSATVEVPQGIFLRASVGSEIALQHYVVVLDCSLGYVFEA